MSDEQIEPVFNQTFPDDGVPPEQLDLLELGDAVREFVSFWRAEGEDREDYQLAAELDREHDDDELAAGRPDERW